MITLHLAALLVATSAAPPRPAFSWSTVPVFQHLASVNATPAAPFPPARLAWLAATFPVVVLEHAHGMGPWAYTAPPGGAAAWGPEPFTPPHTGFIEDVFAYTATAIKSLNSTTTVLYYQQITGALPYYRASAAAADHSLVLDPATCAPLGEARAAPAPAAGRLGDILPNYVSYAWDHLKPAVTANFVAAFANMSARTALDGTFIDTASCYGAAGQADASIATVAAMQAAAPNKLVGFHTEAALSGANGFSMAMDYTFAQPAKKGAPGKDTSCAAGLAWLDANAAAGVLSFAHIGDVDQGPDMLFALACFLAGANNASYFAFSSANKAEAPWMECWDGGSPTAPVFPTWCSGQGWSADYARPLGAPTGPRQPTGGPRGEVARAFASGTRVTVEARGAACSIAWADGHTTTCA